MNKAVFGRDLSPSGGAERTDKPKSGATAFESSGKFPNYRLTSGSRPAELRCHLPLLAKTMDLLRAANRVFVAAAVDENAAKLMREKLPMATIQIGDAPILLAAADAAIVKSGTVTLEAALRKRRRLFFIVLRGWRGK